MGGGSGFAMMTAVPLDIGEAVGVVLLRLYVSGCICDWSDPELAHRALQTW